MQRLPRMSSFSTYCLPYFPRSRDVTRTLPVPAGRTPPRHRNAAPPHSADLYAPTTIVCAAVNVAIRTPPHAVTYLPPHLPRLFCCRPRDIVTSARGCDKTPHAHYKRHTHNSKLIDNGRNAWYTFYAGDGCYIWMRHTCMQHRLPPAVHWNEHCWRHLRRVNKPASPACIAGCTTLRMTTHTAIS